MLGRRGFTLIEIVIALGVIALIAGFLAPQIVSRLQGGESAAMIRNLASIADASHAYGADMGRYPSQLTLLATPPTPTTPDLCGRAVPDPSLWRGPYLNRSLAAIGLPTGSAVIGNGFTRDPPSTVLTADFGYLVVTATGVDRGVAEDVEAQFDGDGNLATGSNRWSAVGDPARGTLTYRVPMRGC